VPFGGPNPPPTPRLKVSASPRATAATRSDARDVPDNCGDRAAGDPPVDFLLRNMLKSLFSRLTQITMRGRQWRRSVQWMGQGVLVLAFLRFAGAGDLTGPGAAPDQRPLVTLSIVGTSDLHGTAFPRNDLGGLPLLAGYVNNLRAARASDNGAVLLIDSGDTFQGGIESNLSEGALVVDAYDAMGY